MNPARAPRERRSDARLLAVDAASGRQRWMHRTGGPVPSTPAVAGGTVYLAPRDGAFLADGLVAVFDESGDAMTGAAIGMALAGLGAVLAGVISTLSSLKGWASILGLVLAVMGGAVVFTRSIPAPVLANDALLVGEAWASLETGGRYRNGGRGLDSVFDFDFGNIVIAILNPDSERRADFGTVAEGSRARSPPASGL